jgi:hypothetical protein
MTRTPDPQVPLSESLTLLARLHRHKDAAYGDAWRKRGEVIAIFANLARKYDRLLVAFDETRPASTEPLADTIADLCVYAAKYLTWLAETQPDAFSQRSPLTPAAASAQRGPAAVEAVFAALPAWERATAIAAPSDTVSGWQSTQRAFGALEHGLMAQATPGAAASELLSWARKVELAWQLTHASAGLLDRLSGDQPEVLGSLRREVEAMDQLTEG